MRPAACRFLAQSVLPTYVTIKGCGSDFYQDLRHLIPSIEQLAGRFPEDDVPARVALAGVAEARRRLYEIESPGLRGEFERVKRLARSVVALCDHHDTLTGMTMCLACDKPIEDGDDSVPYDQISPSGGAVRAGRIHARCANTVRHKR